MIDYFPNQLTTTLKRRREKVAKEEQLKDLAIREVASTMTPPQNQKIVEIQTKELWSKQRLDKLIMEK